MKKITFREEVIKIIDSGVNCQTIEQIADGIIDLIIKVLPLLPIIENNLYETITKEDIFKYLLLIEK